MTSRRSRVPGAPLDGRVRHYRGSGHNAFEAISAAVALVLGGCYEDHLGGEPEGSSASVAGATAPRSGNAGRGAAGDAPDGGGAPASWGGATASTGAGSSGAGGARPVDAGPSLADAAPRDGSADGGIPDATVAPSDAGAVASDPAASASFLQACNDFGRVRRDECNDCRGEATSIACSQFTNEFDELCRPAQRCYARNCAHLFPAAQSDGFCECALSCLPSEASPCAARWAALLTCVTESCIGC